MANSLPSAAGTPLVNEADLKKLWDTFGVFDIDGSGSISAEELAGVMRSLGQSPTEQEVQRLIGEVDLDRSGSVSFDEFKALMISRYGDRASRLKLAFDVFDVDGSGRITANEMRSVMNQVGMTDAELDEFIKEVDLDGDGSIGLDEFCKLMPAEPEGKDGSGRSIFSTATAPLAGAGTTTAASGGTATTAAASGGTATTAAASAGAVTATGAVEAGHQPAPQPEGAAPSPFQAEIAVLKAQLARHPQDEKSRGTSPLQMRIGLFRLIQGAAYRSFRESFSANHETHLRVRNLPYTITDFVAFVRAAISLYKGLGVVDEACHPVLDAVVDSVDAEHARLLDRIRSWPTVHKTPEMLEEEQAMLAARKRSRNTRQKFAAGVDFAIAMQKRRLNLGDVVEGVLALSELTKLREEELSQELAPPPERSEGNPRDYLKKWNRVILSSAMETVDGAMMPVAYWYEDFMPKLLAAFSVTRAEDIPANTVPDEAELERAYRLGEELGLLNQYWGDVMASYKSCSPAERLRIKQAGELTLHYMNGVQKRRERQEFGRETGALSQYVSFIDIYMGRSDVRDAQMRVSFPYYLGPAVWRFFHTTAEIICGMPAERQAEMVARFKTFFKLFATMYPCPYCRHHLNAYVVQNKEVDMYPVEYLLLGQEPRGADFRMSIDDKLSVVKDGPSLRLFLWKLHNTVSSSIARSEEWYHKQEDAFYTTRYWPSVDFELARARAFNHLSISVDRIGRLYTLLNPIGRLAAVRAGLQRLLQKGDAESVKEACEFAQEYIRQLEDTIIEGGFLQETYRFDPTLVETMPAFTPEEEGLARSGYFAEA